ncbi:MAG: phage protein Gp36 family protein [Planctomycetaceae bacterium]
MSGIVYCTRSDVEAVWNPAAVLAAVDDDSSGTMTPAKETLIAMAIERGADRMNAYLEQRYKLSELEGNRWCTGINAQIAAYLLALRRSSSAPAGLSEQYSSAMVDLLEIAAGRLKVPGASGGKMGTELPSVSLFKDDPVTMRVRKR